MTTKNENQSQNQPKDKIKSEINIIEVLVNFRTALAEINLSLDKVFAQIRLDSTELQELRRKLKSDRALWPLEDAEKHLQMIIFLASLGKPQFLQYNDLIIQEARAVTSDNR